MPTSFIYFDLGNVLLRFSHDRMCRQMAEVAGTDPDTVREALFGGGTGSVQWRFERGDATADETYRHFCEQTGTNPNRVELEAAGRDIFDPIDESVDLVRSLKQAGNRLGVFSNTNPTDWEFIVDGRFPFLNECFEHYVLSFEARSMKPEPAIYHHALRRTGVPVGEVFFTDDKQENVDGAVAAGLDAVRFESTAQIRAELEKRGVAF